MLYFKNETFTVNPSFVQVRALDASDDRGYYIAGSHAAITCVVAGTKKLSVEWAFEGTVSLEKCLLT